MSKSQQIDYDDLDPGIRRVVRLLNQHGFVTSDSGDGSKAGVMECAVDYPMVVVVPTSRGEDEAHDIHGLLVGASRDPSVWEQTMERPFAQVEYFYHPHTQTGLISITGFADRDLIDGAGEA
jgi:hypothetical protein